MIRNKLLAIILLFIGTTIYAQNHFEQSGIASFYADRFEGRTTASGEKFTQNKLTAAHLTLPFGTMVKVENIENNKTVEVRINDRGPFVHGRIIDLSKKAAKKLEIVDAGLTEVKIEVISYPKNTKHTAKPKPKKETKIPVQKKNIKQGKKIKPIVQPKEQIKVTSGSKPVTGNKEYYQVQTQKTNPTGYGIQVGSYKELVNLLEAVNRIEKQFKLPVTIEVANVKDEKVYRLLIGKFSNKKEAEKRRPEIDRKYKGCFIKAF